MPRPAADTAEQTVSAIIRSSRLGGGAAVGPSSLPSCTYGAPPGHARARDQGDRRVDSSARAGAGAARGRARRGGPAGAGGRLGGAGRGWKTVTMSDSSPARPSFPVLAGWCELQCPDWRTTLADMAALRARHGDRLEVRLLQL